MWRSFLVIFTIWCYASAESSHEWDFLIYTQTWPAAECRVWSESNPSHACNLPQKKDAWSIHGIWPSVFGSMGPAFCNRTWLFDPKEVLPIESNLEQKWVNIHKGTSTYDLWAHEWNKHGTCAALIEPLNSQIKYFSKGLEWIDTYSMTNILSISNIVPNDDKLYTLDEIFNGIRTKLGVNPEIYCKHDKGKQYLWEIRVCISKSLQLIDCASNKMSLLTSPVITNCNAQGILYTENSKPPSKLLVELYRLATWLERFT